MICEYALEPELVATWYDDLHYHYFITRFGFDPQDGRATGRVVTQYPSRSWKKKVWNAFNANSGQSNSRIERGRITELLKQLGTPSTSRSANTWKDHQSWLENAEQENKRHPFHAILALDNPRNNPQVVRGNDMIEKPPPPIWQVPGETPIQSSAISMATRLEPMLRCATRILFIDPYFRASESRWQDPLQEFLKIICDGSREVTLEYHASASYKGAPSWKHFSRECRCRLSPLIPQGFTLTVHRWENRNNGQQLHNRYILTDIGGVLFGAGLAESAPYDKDDIHRLSYEAWQQRLNDYGNSNPAFDPDPDGDPIVIRGTKP